MGKYTLPQKIQEDSEIQILRYCGSPNLSQRKSSRKIKDSENHYTCVYAMP
jgi:hypothetical protein